MPKDGANAKLSLNYSHYKKEKNTVFSFNVGTFFLSWGKRFQGEFHQFTSGSVSSDFRNGIN
jgi:hypothetical protein